MSTLRNAFTLRLQKFEPDGLSSNVTNVLKNPSSYGSKNSF